jgi:hypothetical protein
MENNQTNLSQRELLKCLEGFHDWLQTASEDELEDCFSSVTSRVQNQLDRDDVDYTWDEEYFSLGVELQHNGKHGGGAGMGSFPSSTISKESRTATIEDGSNQDQLPIMLSISYPHDEAATVHSIRGAFMLPLATEIGYLRNRLHDTDSERI